jgi:anti-sigma-K factor RskA
VVARAAPSALPLAPSGATGEARVLCSGPNLRLHLHVAGLPLQPGYYEVWLIDPDSMEMTAVGVLGDGGDVLLPLASTTDLRKYRLVDISAEQYDNNQAHSGDSLLRGQLTT